MGIYFIGENLLLLAFKYVTNNNIFKIFVVKTNVCNIFFNLNLHAIAETNFSNCMIQMKDKLKVEFKFLVKVRRNS